MYTGYGEDNNILNELEELRNLAQYRANNLMLPGNSRALAQAAADAYAYCILRITQK